nr:double-CXXCG motif protein [Myxococcus sp. MH1]
MARFFWVDEDTAAVRRHGGEVHGGRQWKLPGLLRCPTCDATWSGSGHFFPGVDLSLLPERRELERARPEPLPALDRLRALVRPFIPSGAALPPGTGFGPLEGTGFGKLPAFAWVVEVLLVHQQALEMLHAEGLRGLQGFPAELRFRQKHPPALVELHAPPLGRLHTDCFPPSHPPPCPTCGRLGLRRPDEPILEAAFLPTNIDLFRVGNFATMVIGTSRFKEVVEQLGLDGLTFRELPLR